MNAVAGQEGFKAGLAAPDRHESPKAPGMSLQKHPACPVEKSGGAGTLDPSPQAFSSLLAEGFEVTAGPLQG